MDAAKQAVRDLGTKCADEAWANGGSVRDSCGRLLMGTEPVGGDWTALEALTCGQYAADDDAETFEAAYRERAEALIAGAPMSPEDAGRTCADEDYTDAQNTGTPWTAPASLPPHTSSVLAESFAGADYETAAAAYMERCRELAADEG